jgi:uncharacterized protein YndB with AHSA1/START domain
MNQPPKQGQILFDGPTATLIFKRYLAHPPEAVWDALTDPEQLREWFMTTARIDARPGGTVDLISGPARFHVTGRILEWDPPRLYEYEWNVDPRTELPTGETSIVRWELTPDEEGTLLTLTHRHLTKATALGFAPGTHAFLDRLEAYLDKARIPDWTRRYQEVQGTYPSWETET